MAPTVTDDAARSRYEIRPEGSDEVAGFVEYHRTDERIAFLHTEIDPRYEGRGMAGALARHTLDEARAAGLAVLPYCPYYRAWIARHPEYVSLVPGEDRERFGLPG